MSDGARDFFTILLILAALGVAWYYSGGPERAISRSGPLLSLPTSPTNTTFRVPSVAFSSSSDLYGEERKSGGFFSSFTNYLGTFKENPSPYASLVRFEKGRADAGIQEEYVTIRTTSKAPERLVISGWKIESTVTTRAATIGEASLLPFLGQSTAVEPIALTPNQTAYIATGRSPVGLSFRTNTCTGYFEQYQDFNPRLKIECPNPENEAERVLGTQFNNAQCRDYVRAISRCTITLNAIPGNVGNECQDFIQSKLSYNGCINDHRNDPDFYKNEWYVFLNRDQELWKSDYERLRLLDENGKTVGVVSY